MFVIPSTTILELTDMFIIHLSFKVIRYFFPSVIKTSENELIASLSNMQKLTVSARVFY
jgi:hypothetical protein